MNVAESNKCTGCSLCVISCPVNAIKQVIHPQTAFWYPEIDEKRCIKCNKCMTVCPQNSTEIYTKETTRFIAQSTNVDTLKSATSGGVASALAKAFIDKGGVVYGAAFDTSMKLLHIRCTCEKDLERIRGSKYVQSDILDIYGQISYDLERHRDVLFIGTPCQCAGTKKHFEKYHNFYCCDFICNGVGSPIVFEKHVEYLEETHHCQIDNYIFRPKKYSYLEPYELFIDKDGKEYHNKSPWKKWGSMYYSGLIIRPSCYECKFVESEARAGDITLSDIPISLCETVDYPYEVKKYGASLISINNNRGIALLDNVGTALYIKQVDVEMNNKNKHTQQSPQKRDEFLAGACHSLEKTKLKHFGLSQKIKGSIIEILDNIRKK